MSLSRNLASIRVLYRDVSSTEMEKNSVQFTSHWIEGNNREEA